MQQEALLKLNDLVDRYARHRGFIERARSQTTKFSSSVVERVISDHSVKCAEVSAEILPIVPEIEALIASIQVERDEVGRSKGSVHDQIEELELRLAIGELEQDEFDSLTLEFRASMGESDQKLLALDGQIAELQAGLDRWVELAASAGQADGRQGSPAPAPAAPAPAPVEEPEPAPTQAPVEVKPEISQSLQPVSTPQATPVVAVAAAGAPAVAAQTAIPDDDSVVRGVREDLSEILNTQGQVIVSTPEEEVEAAIEASDVVDEEIADEASADVDFGFDDQGASQDLLKRTEGPEVELDLVEDVETSVGSEDIGVEMESGPAQVDTRAAASDEPRRALLLYQEGTAEEQIYPFTNEVLTIGRGRDNDIQIKNDSKVSRFHCKLFRRGNNFYIEDNRSSNGTLVNGELITERRLFGGEEVIIGETFFRFRIL